MAQIGSSATSVLIAHVAAHTETIRLGAGGIMLPNHSPLAIAEQFGTLAEPAPGPHRPRPRSGAGQRPDHHAGHAPRPHLVGPVPAGRAGAAGLPHRQLRDPRRRRHPRQGHRRAALHPRVVAVRRPAGRRPRAARTRSPRTSRPQALRQAVATYRHEFQPSAQLAEPYVIAGVNVIVADTDEDAQAQLLTVRRSRVRMFVPEGHRASPTSRPTRSWRRRRASRSPR